MKPKVHPASAARPLALLFTLAATSAAFAQAGEQEPSQAGAAESGVAWRDGWTYGARGILGFFTEDTFGPGLGLSGFAVLPLNTDFEIEGEIGYLRTDVDANGLPAGRLSMFPVRATMRLQLWRFGGAMPYTGAGAGIYLSRFTVDPAFADELAEAGLAAAASVDPGLAWHLVGGVEWQRGRAHFGFDVKYVFGNADAVAALVDLAGEGVTREASSFEIDGLWMAFGARFGF